MNITEFPFPDRNYYFEQPWTLQGVTYLFTFRWNVRANLWFVDIADATGAVIIAGVALRTARNLLAQYPTLNLPKGLLFVFDTTGQKKDAGIASFGNTHQLLYVDA